MDTEKRMQLIMSTGEETITAEELKQLLETKTKPATYDGFEPSGQMHIAQGVMRAINTNKMIKAGVHFKFWVADWFAWMNNKMGGDLEKIKKVGEYQVEVWKACGMRVKDVEFLWASDAMAEREYWKRTINIARNNSVQRIVRCSQIMGRTEKDTLSGAQIFYPCMQASDIFHLKADITNLGMDQRKVNILAREVGEKLGYWKPVVVSGHMLMGLLEPKIMNEPNTYILSSIDSLELDNGGKLLIKRLPGKNEIIVEHRTNPFIALRDIYQPVTRAPRKIILEYTSPSGTKQEIEISETEWKNYEDFGIRVTRINPDIPAIELDIATKKTSTERSITMKMSKSIPDSAIFMTDSESEVKRKIEKAYCPEKQLEENPLMEYMKYIIFESFPKVKIERPAKFGGDLIYDSFDQMAEDFKYGRLHPMDLKSATAEHINKLLEPVRKHFSKGKSKELAEFVKKQQVTR